MRINRRHLILGATGLLCWPRVARARDRMEPSEASDILPLWPDLPPGGGGPSGPIEVSGKGTIRNIAVPALELYRPERANGMAVLVAAGGGYKRIQMESEARPAARWLAARGVTAFVLRYRLPGEGWTNGPLAPLQDAQRALRLVASSAGRLKLDVARIGVLGFSAGGHLMGLAPTRSAFASYAPVDGLDSGSARPARAALIYPVVTLMPPYDHTSTRVQLVGHHPTRAMSAEWSVETHVRARCPPLFLVQAEDDPISNIANTALLERAAREADVPVERHVLPSGGHGFGLGRPGAPSAEWPEWYAAWAGFA